MKFAILLMLTCGAAAAAEWQPLWPAAAPGMAAAAAKTGIPAYQVHLPEPARRNGAAIAIFPGGGYARLALGHEGEDYAKWLTARGITAVVVKYRVSGDDGAACHFPIPLLDARRAVRSTRARAAEWGVDPAKVGVMGSSAGGHLASMCATVWDEPLAGETKDEIDALDCRPDFAVLVYPVITMADDWGHAGSRRRLLGPAAEPALARRLSTQLRVNERTPPCFLIHAADDPGVPVRNSLEFAARCAEHRVPVVCHVFANGGHGFGLRGRGDSQEWPVLLERWLQQRVGPATAAGK